MKSKGFTLLEIMVVLLIIGIATSVVMLNFNNQDYQKDLKKQAQRFQTVVSMASEFAILNQQQLGVSVKGNRYKFVILDDEQKWQLITDEPALAEFALPEIFALELKLDGLPWQDEDSLFDNKLFDEPSAFDEYEQQKQDEEEKQLPPPQIYILSSGDITPFSLSFIFEAEYQDVAPSYFQVNSLDSLPLEFLGPLDGL
ncbi:type II secretion system minor pseudopilin GspH [Alteromonadaceae bacterium BrNp21-10]|nr:type II secretion system minor pseudopilin GspH [Alteromonadaceae bacterium BrNp21-10]